MANQVLEIIKQRHYSNSKPGKRDDPYKLALCIQGGGMRGVVSAGALAAMDQLNLQHVFDVVYGSSAGAYNGCYFLSGNPLQGLKLYLDHLNNHRFVSYSRMLFGPTAFGLDYLHEQIAKIAPLDWHRLIYAKPQVHIIGTDVQHARPTIFKNYKTSQELIHALYASAYFPSLFRSRPFRLRRHKYFDTAMSDPFCIHSALKEGATHILILFSAPYHEHPHLGIVDRDFLVPQLNKFNEHLGEMRLKHYEYSVNGLSHIWNHYDGTHILTVAPKNKKGLPNELTTNRKKLAQGIIIGAKALFDGFAVHQDLQQLALKNIRQEVKI